MNYMSENSGSDFTFFHDLNIFCTIHPKLPELIRNFDIFSERDKNISLCGNGLFYIHLIAEYVVLHSSLRFFSFAVLPVCCRPVAKTSACRGLSPTRFPAGRLKAPISSFTNRVKLTPTGVRLPTETDSTALRAWLPGSMN